MDIRTAFQNFKSEWMSKRVDTDGVPVGEIYQCVDLPKQYMKEVFGMPLGAFGNAITYWTATNPTILTRFDKLETHDVQVGDITVINPDHIGIATGNVAGDTFEMLEQNGSTGNGQGIGGDAIRTRYIPFNRIAGILRPKDVVVTPVATPPPYTPVRVGQTLVMPASEPVWHFYKVGGPYVLQHAQGYLEPQKFGGLEYVIQANPEPNIYVINTQMFGQVAVYAGPDTSAQFKDAAAPAPAPVEAPAAPAVVKPANTTYTKLDNPLALVTNKQPTHLWALDFPDYAHVTSAAQLPANTAFTAYGKAQRTDLDHPVYYMSEADFGQADTTGAPAINTGINTVDLSPAPVTEPAPAVDTAVAVPVTKTESPTIASASPPMSSVIPVTPPKPDWQITTVNVADYRATQDYDVVDLATDTPVATLLSGQTVHAVVRFTKPDSQGRDVEYVMTQKSVDTGKFNGIPLGVLQVIKAVDIQEPLVDTVLQEVAESVKDFAIATVERAKKDSALREKIVAFIARFVFRAKKTNKVKG